MGYLGSTFNGKPRVKRTFLAFVLTPKLALQSCLKIAHLYLLPSYDDLYLGSCMYLHKRKNMRKRIRPLAPTQINANMYAYDNICRCMSKIQKMYVQLYTHTH